MKDDFHSYDIPILKRIGVCENCGAKIYRRNGVVDKHYICKYKGSEIMLCAHCVKDGYEEFCRGWSGGFG